MSFSGVIYIATNVGASLLALGAIQAFDWTFGATGDAVAATQVLVAGLGAMALVRSSLLTVKVGDDDVGIGPSSVLSVLMAASDRSADRLRAADRAGRVNDIMDDVSYAKAQDALPTVAVALMQNLSAADVAALRNELQGLKSEPLPDNTQFSVVTNRAVLAVARYRPAGCQRGRGLMAIAAAWTSGVL